MLVRRNPDLDVSSQSFFLRVESALREAAGGDVEATIIFGIGFAAAMQPGDPRPRIVIPVFGEATPISTLAQADLTNADIIVPMAPEDAVRIVDTIAPPCVLILPETPRRHAALPPSPPVVAASGNALRQYPELLAAIPRLTAAVVDFDAAACVASACLEGLVLLEQNAPERLTAQEG